jgi:hypothetical protein
MEQHYTPAQLAAIAQQTAHGVHAQALYWWQNPSDPAELYIEATTTQGNLPLLLIAILPQASLS